MESVPDLTGSLRVVEALKAQPVAPSDGPRQWWKGPLDVGGWLWVRSRQQPRP
ncbi:hypothetical protein [Pseudarthrobacter sp. AL20]|uniref:hypothetical protein n=1 Tax=unclassified Pseudarthrobacter TaxID=2647000 RepID=UPI0032B83298